MLSRLFNNLFKSPPHPEQQQEGELVLLSDKIQEGFAAYESKEYTASLNIARALLHANPNLPDGQLLEGINLIALDNVDAAIAVLRRLVTQQPENAVAWKAIGDAAEKTNQPKLMVECYEASLEIDPNQIDLETALGNFFYRQRQYMVSRRHFERAVAIQPAAGAYLNLAATISVMGRTKLACDALKHALSIDPEYIDAYRALLGLQLYLARRPDEVDRDAYQAFAACVHRSVEGATFSEINLPSNPTRIRIAYLTSDFCTHPVTRNMLPILTKHDRLRFEICIYADIRRFDEFTVRCQQQADIWRDISGLSDREVAEKIHEDKISILVILAGRFDQNRPQICAYRAAPIQVSYHDGATSGLPEMDYLISDINMTPRNTKEWFSERVVRLPTFYVHEPIEDAPEISALPVKRNGYVTFGSFNNPTKLNADVFQLWARILKAVPGSRLVLKHMGKFREPEIRDWCLSSICAFGIDERRIEFPDQLNDRASHLTLYQQIDIALDTFPFTGSTTTFEALWMGVPVVTLAGELMVGRWSASMLRRVGLTALIAYTEDEYVATAVALATDLSRLDTMHSTLREQVSQSSLCNAHRTTRHLERVYRYMWHKWRATQATEDMSGVAQEPVTPIDLDHDLDAILELARSGQQGMAAVALERLLSHLPPPSEDIAITLNDFSAKLLEAGNPDLALRILAMIQERTPDMPSVLCNLGIAFAQRGRFEEAITYFSQGNKIAPNYIPLAFNHALTLCELERYDEARTLLNGIISQNDTHIGAWMALAEVERQAGNIQQAVLSAQRALDTEPTDIDARVTMGNMLRESGDLDTAVTHFEHALARYPNHAEAQLGLAFVYLLQGQFQKGWPLYEARRVTSKSTERLIGYPEWQGEALGGKTLLIYGEQGLGDDIMFASCYQEMINEGGKVVIDCEPRLASLFARSFPQALVFGSPRYGIPTWISRVSNIDFKIPSGSLPRISRTQWIDFPRHQGYLRPDQERVEIWQDKLRRLGPGLKVGIAWQGGMGKTRKAARSIPLDQWAPILSTQGCRFFSLQHGKAIRDVEAAQRAGFDVTHWEEAIGDLEETAALVASLDLVITVCSTLVHLTGALGKPVWVLAPRVPEWRYLVSGDKMPWYPSARLFRASGEGERPTIIEDVKNELSQLVKSNAGKALIK